MNNAPTDKLYTIAEISKQLQIPESSVRFYRDKFSEYIPSIGQGRSKRYKPEAITVIKLIAEEMQNRKTAMEIAERLSYEFPRVIDVLSEPQPQTAAAQQQSLNPINTGIDGILKLYTQQQERITQLERLVIHSTEQAQLAKDEAHEARKYIEDKLDERDRKLMEYIRNQQQQPQCGKPWWRFWDK